jgi:hypothetical protein
MLLEATLLLANGLEGIQAMDSKIYTCFVVSEQDKIENAQNSHVPPVLLTSLRIFNIALYTTSYQPVYFLDFCVSM